jgi:Holliday junction resolvase
VSRAERDKGSRGELEVAAIFRAAGFDCDRTPNSGGLRIVGDLYGEALPFHVEVKRQEVARPWLWMAQASADAGTDATPLVAFRRNRSRWLALVDLEALVSLATAVRARV